MKRHIFPFSALVGQEPMKSALLLNAIDPTIGGVLIAGQKGTGKSSAVRALTRILPAIEVVAGCPYNCAPAEQQLWCRDCAEKAESGSPLPAERRPMPLVELPLSTTEDRLVGTLHIEKMLRDGVRRFEPGLLAAAHRGILYVDEVNLLDDHLVDVLLDAAASGVNLVEREGVSFSHPARFMLIGTMNPEEGDLRPQFLDRFGLSLQIAGLVDADQRRLIVQRRLAYDRDPDGFTARFREVDAHLGDQVRTARNGLAAVAVPEAMIRTAVDLAARAEAQGHRAEITIVKTARALASFLECDEVAPDHVLEAARFALPHRLATLPLATPELIEQELAGLLDSERAPMPGRGDPDPAATSGDAADDWAEDAQQVPGSTAAANSSMMFAFLEEKKKPSMRPMT